MGSLDIVKSEIESELLNHILPFWTALKDETYGGYFGKLDYDLSLHKDAPKGGIATARLLWSFSAAYRKTGISLYAEQAEHAFRFLQNRLLDREFGGIYWAVDYKGNPLDTRKHIYNQSFAVYSLSEYYLASRNAEALELAKELYYLIEDRGYNAEAGGYKEEFDREWNERENEMLSDNGVMAAMTMNTHIHVLEAYTTLYRAWPDERVRASVAGLMNILYEKIYDPGKQRLNVFFDHEWNSLVDLTSYGHDIEASWLMDEAMKAIGSDNSDHRRMIIDLAYAVAREAVQSDGSLANEKEGAHTDTSRIWWVQAEAMVGFHNAYTRTQDAMFIELATNLWTYTKNNIIDSRRGGEWLWAVEEDGTHDTRELAGPWKCPYHNSRFCIELIERMNTP
ncbi:AGE family epimerase/isomerase [Paenibacillus thailandensis]|uniref:Cellobiose 2-epimerase n=1 Tax=Paenibacillus thailandensis TaxID=393250 RepID=A0ABW5QRQ7_9BACL